MFSQGIKANDNYNFLTEFKKLSEKLEFEGQTGSLTGNSKKPLKDLVKIGSVSQIITILRLLYPFCIVEEERKDFSKANWGNQQIDGLYVSKADLNQTGEIIKVVNQLEKLPENRQFEKSQFLMDLSKFIHESYLGKPFLETDPIYKLVYSPNFLWEGTALKK